jgi:hypothetical protein
MPVDALPRFSAPWRRFFSAVLVFSLGTGAACAQTLSSKAKESGCVDSPKVVEGSTYRCTTASGAAAYFNVPANNNHGTERAPRRPVTSSVPAAPPAAGNHVPPPSLPRVDAATQKSRDELKRRVLQDELAAEEKLLAEARSAYANGAPPPLPEEQAQPQRYAERIARLRQAVQLHERNIEALRRELGLAR